VDEIGVSVKSIPRHENQHTAAMWWTVDHVASNQQSGVEGGGGMVVYIVHRYALCYSCYFCFPCDVHLYLSQLISIGILYILFV